jgi:hypothetical protein
MKERGIGGQFVWSGFDVVTEMADNIDGSVARIEQKAAQNGVYRPGLEFERGDHSKVAAPATEGPEQILVLRVAGSEHFAVGGNDLARNEIINGHAVLTKQPTDATTQGEARNASFRDYPARNSETEWMGFPVKITKSGAALNANSASGWFHMDCAHAGEVNHNAIVTKCATTDVVTATSYRRQQILSARKLNGSDDIGDA